ncbi:DUF4232 domain-containing protein [uncultured Streptomyces sp.]|uniref:DUF4232 domain-containing protein n=1 Tax=uncultured Streptomyces sp. TaxID=174707 RepID=UPI00260DD70F|nr:DUF4232 domain-containing protein [uncultured Streptomyces sp.]
MNLHTTRRPLMLAVAGTALVLSLTACQAEGDSGPAAAAASSPGTTGGENAPTSDAADASDAEPSAAAKDTTGSAASTGGETAASTGTKGTRAGTTAPVCTAGDVDVTAAKQDGPPYTHLVLTAKNTSARSCRLAGYPHLQFLESHKQDAPAVAKSKPATPVVLAPGAPAYALVKLSDGGVDEENEPVSAFSLTLEGDDDTVIAVTAPGGDGVAVDPARALTGYWTPELRNGADDF